MRRSQPRQLAHLVLDGEHGSPLRRQRLEPLRRELESRERGRILAPRRPPGERLDRDHVSVLQRHRERAAIGGERLLGQRQQRAQDSRRAVVLSVAGPAQRSDHEPQRRLGLADHLRAGRHLAFEEPLEQVATASDLALLQRALAEETGGGDHGRRVGGRRVDRVRRAMPGIEDDEAKRLRARRDRTDQQLPLVFQLEPHLGAGLGRLSQQRLQVGPRRQVCLAQGQRLRRHVARPQPVEGVAEEHRGVGDAREACRERGQREVVADDLGERVLHLETALELVALRPDLVVQRLEAQARLVLGGVEASVDDGDRGGLRERIEQLHVERKEDLGLVEVLDDHGAERLALVHQRRADRALRVVGAAAGLEERLQVGRLRGGHHRLDLLLVLVDLGPAAEKRAPGKALAGFDGQLVDARVEADGVVDRKRVPLRVIKEEDSRLGRGQDADRSLQDAVDDLLEVELGRQRPAHLDQSDQAVELGLDELRGGAGHLLPAIDHIARGRGAPPRATPRGSLGLTLRNFRWHRRTSRLRQVEPHRDRRADEWTNKVNPQVGPRAMTEENGRRRRAHTYSRIERRARDGTGDEGAGCNSEPDSDSVVGVPGRLPRSRHVQHNEDQRHGEYQFGRNSRVPADSDSRMNARGATADRIGKGERDEPGRKLCDPVGEHRRRWNDSTQKETQRDGRVVVSAGYMTAHVNHRRQREADCHGS